jgi:baseplate J-like protein
VPIRLPNLDDLRWQDLVAEGVSLIPASAPEWTNHNPSDPGITLIELFAYVSERLMYQLNRVNDKNVLRFLKLINGPGWEKRKELIEERRFALRSMRELRRAVTPEDFEHLAGAVDTVARTKCVARRNLASGDPALRMAEAPGHVSIVVLTDGDLHPSHALLAKTRQALEPARLLTTRVHVVGPKYVPISCSIAIVPRRGTYTQALQEDAIQRLKLFLDPHRGGFDGKGWPWGRSVYLSELYQVLSEIPGVESVVPTRDAQGIPLDEIVVGSSHKNRVKRNQRGEIEAVELQPDELIEPLIGPEDVVIASHA